MSKGLRTAALLSKLLIKRRARGELTQVKGQIKYDQGTCLKLR